MNYRINITIRQQGGSVFNSEKYCTEDYDGTIEDMAEFISKDIALWLTENITAAEEMDDAN